MKQIIKDIRDPQVVARCKKALRIYSEGYTINIAAKRAAVSTVVIGLYLKENGQTLADYRRRMTRN